MKHSDTVAPPTAADSKPATQVRTEPAFSNTLATGSPSRVQASEQCPDQSAEFLDKPGLRLERARVRFAWMLEDLLRKHARAGNAQYSRRAIAARYIGDDEKIVRTWARADGKRPMPAAAFLLLPDEIFEDLVGLIRVERKRGGRP